MFKKYTERVKRIANYIKTYLLGCLIKNQPSDNCEIFETSFV